MHLRRDREECQCCRRLASRRKGSRAGGAGSVTRLPSAASPPRARTVVRIVRGDAGVDAGLGHHGAVDGHVVLGGGVVAPVDRAEVQRGAVGAVGAVERTVPDLDAGRAGGERPAVADVVAVGGGEQLAGLALGQHQRGADVAGQRRYGDGTVLEAQPVRRGPPSGTTWSATATSCAVGPVVRGGSPSGSRLSAQYRLRPHPTSLGRSGECCNATSVRAEPGSVDPRRPNLCRRSHSLRRTGDGERQAEVGVASRPPRAVPPQTFARTSPRAPRRRSVAACSRSPRPARRPPTQPARSGR